LDEKGSVSGRVTVQVKIGRMDLGLMIQFLRRRDDTGERLEEGIAIFQIVRKIASVEHGRVAEERTFRFQVK